jgi:nucleoside-diphosphate-sugar epimerase
MSKVLITGSSGFIGVNLVNYLQSKSFIIEAFSRDLGLNYDSLDIEYINNNEIGLIIHLAGIAHDIKNNNSASLYYKVNTDLTKQVYDAFVKSNAKMFIFLSSVKAVADNPNSILYEDQIPKPDTHYGKSKLLAENYILSKDIPTNKRVFILRPCMIHGPGNKGNLNLLYKLVQKGLPWPLGAFENKRSFCSIENLCFIINELIENEKIHSGIYNISDTDSISTNDLIRLIGTSKSTKPKIWFIPKYIIKLIAKLGDIFRLPLNSERLKKLTENYVVSNDKILININKSLPLSSSSGILKTLKSFN